MTLLAGWMVKGGGWSGLQMKLSVKLAGEVHTERQPQMNLPKRLSVTV